MIENFSSLQLVCLTLMTLSLVAMHVVKKYTALASAYVLQSLCLLVLLGIELSEHFSWGILGIFFVTLIIKIVIIPKVFSRIIKQSRLNLLSPTYLTIPMTLCVLLLLLIFARSDVLSPLATLLSEPLELRTMLFGNLLLSIFLIINRKGALSQIIGILSLENMIFVLSIFLQIKQLFSLELGILFNLLFWVIASSIFLKGLFQKFGSYDITALNQLKK